MIRGVTLRGLWCFECVVYCLLIDSCMYWNHILYSKLYFSAYFCVIRSANQRWYTQKSQHKSNWSRDGPRLKSDNFRKGCKLQDRGAGQGQSESRQHVVAHDRGGREVRLARGGIREQEAFLGHEMRGPAGTGRGGVSMVRWLGDGKAKAQGWRMGGGAIACHHHHIFFLEFTYVFRLSVSIRKVASEYLFCVLIYTNSYIFHIFSFYFFACQTHLIQWIFNMLDVIIGRHTKIILLSPHG